MARIGILIVAGGCGRRAGGSLPKQFRLLNGRPVLLHTIERFAAALPGAEIAVVLPAEHLAFWQNLAARFEVPRHSAVAGGDERFHSVKNGLAALRSDPELIVVQDGVRPLATPELIGRVVEAAAACGAAIPVVEPVDSFRTVESGATEALASHPIDRRRLRIVQTPQVFRAEVLREAYAADFRPEFTDDASVVEASGHAVRLVEGDPGNLKLTTPEDFILAEALLAARTAEEDSPEEDASSSGDPRFRTDPNEKTDALHL